MPRIPMWWKCDYCGLELSLSEVVGSGGHDCRTTHDWTPDAERESRHWDAIVNDAPDAAPESVKADDGK